MERVRLTLRPRMKAGEDWVEYWKRTSGEGQMEEDANADGRTQRQDALEDHGLRCIRGRSRYDSAAFGSGGGGAGVLGRREDGNTGGVFTTARSWDTPMERWAGEGFDWVHKLILHPLQKDVIISFLRMMRQRRSQQSQENSTSP